MSDLYSIIKQLQEAQGSNAKQAILNANKDNELLREYMKAVYDPAINYYQTKILKPKNFSKDNLEFGKGALIELKSLSQRKITGNLAKDCLSNLYSLYDEDGRYLIELVIKRSIGASVGETMVLKTWPGLFFVPPYMRCSLMDEKVKAKFKNESDFFVQLKADGSFAYLVVDHFNGHRVVTRNGNTYPTELAKHLAGNLPDGAYVGELEVYQQTCYQDTLELLDRKTGNGKLNSLLQGDVDILDQYEVFMSAWDYLSLEEFEQGKSEDGYAKRFDDLCYHLEKSPYVDVIETHIVNSLEEAYKIYSDYTSNGYEGAIIKTCTHKWKDGTSKECVKLKIEFEAEYVITGYYEGEGKAEGMLGGLSCQSSDGVVKFNVGSGFNDEQRKHFWSIREDLVGKVVTIKANDVVTKRGSEDVSLFLPIFQFFRPDKSEADSYHRVMQQLNAVKGIS